MPITIRRSAPGPTREHPEEALLACHGRIRSFMALARALVTREDATDAQRREAAHDVKRYFTEALPDHATDEDLSLVPRLAGQSAALDAALEKMHAEHLEMEPLLAQLCERCEAAESDPGSCVRDRSAWIALLDDLDARWSAHLGLEEREIFPVLRGLDDATCQAIRQEMRSRREPRA